MLFFICFIYLFTLFISSGSLSLLTLLVLLELMSWLFVILIPSFFSLNYLIIQSYFLVMSLVGILYLPFILIFSFFMKLGLPPFHMWFLRVANVLSKSIFGFMMTFHKLVPIFFLGKVLVSMASFFALGLSLFIVSYTLLMSSTLFFTLTFSSMLHSMWMTISLFLSKGFVLFYWLFYSSLLILLMVFISFIKIDQSFLTQNVLTGKCWLLMSGVPPFMMFWLKVFVLFWLGFSLGIFMSFIVLLISVFALTSYYRTWHFGSLLGSSFPGNGAFSPFLFTFMFWALFYQ